MKYLTCQLCVSKKKKIQNWNYSELSQSKDYIKKPCQNYNHFVKISNLILESTYNFRKVGYEACEL